MHIAHVPLEGPAIRLDPYRDELRDPLRAALDVDPDAWRLFALSGAGEHFDGWWAVHTRPGWLAYVIREGPGPSPRGRDGRRLTHAFVAASDGAGWISGCPHNRDTRPPR